MGIEEIDEGAGQRLVEISLLFPEELEGHVFRADERTEAPGQLAPDEKHDHDPETEDGDSGFRIDVLLFTGVLQAVDDVLHSEYAGERDDGHVQELDEGVIAACDQKEKHDGGKRNHDGRGVDESRQDDRNHLRKRQSRTEHGLNDVKRGEADQDQQ